jgi:phage-related protein
MSIFSDIFDFLKNLFSALWKFLKENLWIIVLALVAIYLWAPSLWATIWGWISTVAWPAIVSAASSVWTWIGDLTPTELLTGAAALWFVSDPEGAIDTVSDVVFSLTEAVTGGVASGLGLPGLAIAAVGFWLFFGKDDDKKEELS